MPYLRYYHSQDVPIEQKRVIAQKLIDITIHAFRLRTEERSRITIQFIKKPKECDAEGWQLAIPRDTDCTLEVMAHDLTEGKKNAFTAEAGAMLAHSIPVKQRSLISRVLRLASGPPARVALQFSELNSAVSDPFVASSERLAA
jgi:hypothetical protein